MQLLGHICFGSVAGWSVASIYLTQYRSTAAPRWRRWGLSATAYALALAGYPLTAAFVVTPDAALWVTAGLAAGATLRMASTAHPGLP